MKKTKTSPVWLFVIVIILAAAATFLTAYIITSKNVVGAKTVLMDLEVQQNPAINLATDMMHLGGIVPGGSSKRGLMLSNDKAFPVKAIIYLKGEQLTGWVLPDENPVLLQPLEQNKSVNFTATVPSNAQFGNYTGEITIVFKKA